MYINVPIRHVVHITGDMYISPYTMIMKNIIYKIIKSSGGIHCIPYCEHVDMHMANFVTCILTIDKNTTIILQKRNEPRLERCS